MKTKETLRKIRHQRIRRKLKGSQSLPRLVVFRSNSQIYAQIIDDTKHATLASASSLNRQQKGSKDQKVSKIEITYRVGEKLAKDALAKKIKKVIFDRAGYKYHGRVKTLADGAKKGGLVF